MYASATALALNCEPLATPDEHRLRSDNASAGFFKSARVVDCGVWPSAGIHWAPSLLRAPDFHSISTPSSSAVLGAEESAPLLEHWNVSATPYWSTRFGRKAQRRPSIRWHGRNHTESVRFIFPQTAHLCENETRHVGAACYVHAGAVGRLTQIVTNMAARKKHTKHVTKSSQTQKRQKLTLTHETLTHETAAPMQPILDHLGTNFPIVGIGASAGGIAALEAFFSGMPKDTDPGMAFVVVQHLSPDHKSILSEIIGRSTRMEVFEVEDGMVVKPNCTYIIPPNRDMAFLKGTLQLLEPAAPRGQRLPIDFLFRSLARDQHERAIGIILSGTGSDGTVGIRFIKDAGGMVMAQTPASTEYDGMPRSAINTGLVDYELAPAQMPDQIIAYVTHAFGHPPHPRTISTPVNEQALKKVFVLLRARTMHDFSGYKPSTILRRIERRMAVHQIKSMDEYIMYLQRQPSEVEVLFRHLLIGVTSFFRDADAFKALEEQVIPNIFANKQPGAAIRVWTTGCSTGEEAYSLAILLHEHMERLRQGFKLQVFATDIDRHAIATARAGIYPAGITTNISPERLTRFFTTTPGDSTYRICKTIRDIVIFSEQDVVEDPPFSKLDLVSCRNLLIYMSSELQKKLFPVFHYALQPGGFLFLGTSETVNEFSRLFSTIDRKWKIYQREEDKFGTRHMLMERFAAPMTPSSASPRSLAVQTDHPPLPSLRERTEKALLQHYAPPSVLVTKTGEVLYLYGRTGLYLELPPGPLGPLNILTMAREGLREALSTALNKAAMENVEVRRRDLRVKTNGDFTKVNLTIHPTTPPVPNSTEKPLYLVTMESVIPPENNATPNAAESRALTKTTASLTDADVDSNLVSLRQELQVKEEYLQMANEKLETSNEELKASNEEMHSINEELQSTNEELETSKEELQSVNEELTTVNVELQTKMAEASQSNNDMNNLLAGTGIATIFVDHHLRILRFTPTITQIINLVPSDIGRPVGHISSNLMGYDKMVEHTRAVLDTLIPREVEVQTRVGGWYTMRIRLYRTLENVIDGAVITFVDITEKKRAVDALRVSEAKYRNLAMYSRDAVMIERENDIVFANEACVKLFGARNESDLMSKSMSDLFNEETREAMNDCIRRLRATSETVSQIKAKVVRFDGRSIDVEVLLAPIPHGMSKDTHVILREMIQN